MHAILPERQKLRAIRAIKQRAHPCDTDLDDIVFLVYDLVVWSEHLFSRKRPAKEDGILTREKENGSRNSEKAIVF